MTNDSIIKTMPQDAFAALGGGQIAYLRSLRSEDVHALFPQARSLPLELRFGRSCRLPASRSC